ncbi:MAG: type II secretion system protein [Polyangiaceae bacterium]
MLRIGKRAFSLLEVMVAVAILGLALTVILSAQGGLAASNKNAQNMGLATTLARCRMTETEEELLRLGYPEIDKDDRDISCCSGEDHEGFVCDILVQKVELPNPPQNSLGDGGTLSSAITGVASNSNALGSTGGLNFDAGIQGLGAQVSQMTGQGGAASGAGAAGMLNMVMGMVYPSLKPVMEASIRRVTVTVRWKEGPNNKDFSLVQFVTNPQRGGFMQGFDGGAPPVIPGTSGGTTSGGTSSGGTSGGTTSGGLSGSSGGVPVIK